MAIDIYLIRKQNSKRTIKKKEDQKDNRFNIKSGRMLIFYLYTLRNLFKYLIGANAERRGRDESIGRKRKASS